MAVMMQWEMMVFLWLSVFFDSLLIQGLLCKVITCYKYVEEANLVP